MPAACDGVGFVCLFSLALALGVGHNRSISVRFPPLERVTADTEHAQIVLGKIDILSAIERTLSPKSIALVPDRPKWQPAFTGIADLPIGEWRLLDEDTFRQQPVKDRAKERRREGRPYKSLSAIARAITGTRWNGWVFFGLKNHRRGA